MITTDRKTFCAKRALARLNVSEKWEVPTERNRYEALWYQTAGKIVPGAVPEVIAVDSALGVFAMEYFDPADFSLWKTKLSEGQADPTDAGAVGSVLGHIHSACADRPDIESNFQTADLFEALRLSPYLRFTADSHPDIADRLHDMANRVASYAPFRPH